MQLNTMIQKTELETATLRTDTSLKRGDLLAKLMTARQTLLADIRNILRPDQQQVFDQMPVPPLPALPPLVPAVH
jgi:hypothetical protein